VQPGRRRLILEFEPGSDPISGTLLDDYGGGRPFTGWLQLAAALEVALNAAQNEGAGSTSPQT
jgi:hypothetical protein